MLGDGYDPEVTDQTLRREIELVSNVMTAVAPAERRLTSAELDEVLGAKADEPHSPGGDAAIPLPPGQ
jgi:hypothetical protein